MIIRYPNRKEPDLQYTCLKDARIEIQISRRCQCRGQVPRQRKHTSCDASDVIVLRMESEQAYSVDTYRAGNNNGRKVVPENSMPLLEDLYMLQPAP